MARNKTIANKLIRALILAKQGKVVDLNMVKDAKRIAKEQGAQMPSPDELSETHPAFGMYILAQHQLVNFMEILQNTRELSKFVKIYIAAEDEYMPSGPPISPITASNFFGWSYLDFAIGPFKETLVDILGKVGLWAGLHPAYGPLFEKFSRSRLGLFRHEGLSGESVTLREIGTGTKVTAVVSSGDQGTSGDLWLARILPPPNDLFPVSVVFGTPYKILHPDESAWLAYLARTYPKTGKKTDQEAHESLMKYGLDSRYWLEYIFEAYVNHTPNIIYLQGLPDIDESRPHSRVNS